MKFCILTSRFPFPQYSGGLLRINEISRYLKSKGHSLILVSLSDDNNPSIAEAKDLYDQIYYVKRNRFSTIINCILYFIRRKPLQCGYYRSSRYSRLLKEVIKRENPDVYVSHLLRMVPYLEELGLEDKSIVEMTDALSKTYSLSSLAKSGGLLKYIYKVERGLILKYEKKVISKFKKVILVSQADIDYLRRFIVNSPSLCVYTNGVTIMDSIPADYERTRVCFMGSMGFLPNQDAVLFFIKDVLPLIKKEVPDVQFHVVGSRPSERLLQLAEQYEDVIVTGFVDDLNEYISRACVSVAPIRVAAGIQNKVLVSMGCGVPVVLTPLISKAIPELVDFHNCFIANTAEEIARAVVSVLKDPELRNRIGASGYDVVKSHYDWASTLDGYEIL